MISVCLVATILQESQRRHLSRHDRPVAREVAPPVVVTALHALKKSIFQIKNLCSSFLVSGYRSQPSRRPNLNSETKPKSEIKPKSEATPKSETKPIFLVRRSHWQGAAHARGPQRRVHHGCHRHRHCSLPIILAPSVCGGHPGLQVRPCSGLIHECGFRLWSLRPWYGPSSKALGRVHCCLAS